MLEYEALHMMYLRLAREQANAIDVLQKTLFNLTLAMQEAEELWLNAESPQVIAHPKLHAKKQPGAES